MINLGQVSAIYKGTTAPTNKNLIWAKTDTDVAATQIVQEWCIWYKNAWTSFYDIFNGVHTGTTAPVDTNKTWKVVDGGGEFLGFKVYETATATWIDLYHDLTSAATANAITELVAGASSSYTDFEKVEARISEVRMDQVSTPTGRVLALTDAYKVLDCSNTGAISLQIPLNSAVAFDIGTIIVIERNGSGSVTVFSPTGVTINGVDAESYVITNQYDACSIRKRATNDWVIKGNIT